MPCLPWVLVKEGEMFLKTFIINQRNHLQGTSLLYLKCSGWSSLQPLCVSVLSLDTVDRQVFCPLLVLRSLCHHLFTTATGKDEKDRRQEMIIHFFHAVESKTLGGCFIGEVLSWETREKELRVWKEIVYRTDLVGGFSWVDRPFKLLTDSGKPRRHVYK